MILKYKVKSYQVKETTKERGIVHYVLVGEQGKEREVSAIAVLGKKGVKSVHAIHKREQPLIDILSKASINEIIEVDFTSYNKQYPRDFKGPTTVVARTTKVADPYQDSLITDFNSIKEKKFRILKLIGLSALVLTAFMFAKDSFF